MEYKNVHVFENDDEYIKYLKPENENDSYSILRRLVSDNMNIKTAADVISLIRRAPNSQDRDYPYYFEIKFYEGTTYAIKSKKMKYRSFLDIINEKNNINISAFDLLKELRKTPEYKEDSEPQKPLLQANSAFLVYVYSLLMTYFLENEKYRNAVAVFSEALRVVKITSAGLSRSYWEMTRDNKKNKELMLRLAREALCLLIGGSKDKNFMESNLPSHCVSLYKEYSDKCQLELLTDETIILYHKLALRLYKPYFEKIQTSNGLSEKSLRLYGLDFLADNPNELEAIFNLVLKNKDDIDYRIAHSYNVFEFYSLHQLRPIKDSPNLESELLSILKNYFYSKYGRGQKYSKLSGYLSAAKYLMKLYDLDCNILDLVEDLPEKIQAAALRGELGD